MLYPTIGIGIVIVGGLVHVIPAGFSGFIPGFTLGGVLV